MDAFDDFQPLGEAGNPLTARFAYDDWANRTLLDAMLEIAEPPDVAVKRLAHVIGTGFLWLCRLEGRPSPVPIWPQWTLQQSRTQLDQLIPQRRGYIARGGSRGLERPIRYTNSKGELFTNPVSDILEHWLLHGAYHRGQIASDLAAAGIRPPLTDYIEARRRGFA